MFRALKTLKILLSKLSQQPEGKELWHFKGEKLVRECRMLGVTTAVEDLAGTVQNKEVAGLALACLEHLKEPHNDV